MGDNAAALDSHTSMRAPPPPRLSVARTAGVRLLIGDVPLSARLQQRCIFACSLHAAGPSPGGGPRVPCYVQFYRCNSATQQFLRVPGVLYRSCRCNCNATDGRRRPPGLKSKGNHFRGAPAGGGGGVSRMGIAMAGVGRMGWKRQRRRGGRGPQAACQPALEAPVMWRGLTDRLTYTC